MNDFKEYRKEFGRHLKSLREKRKLSPIDLADRVEGIDPKQIYRIENAENIPSHELIIAIAVALGYTPAQLHDFEFPLILNTDFTKSTVPSKTNNLVYLEYLIDKTDFFEDFRSVSEIRSKCKELYNVDLKSTPVSIALKSMVDKNRLIREQSVDRRNHYTYKLKPQI